MGYYLSAFIGKPEDLKIIVETYPVSKIVDLAQGLSLVPFTEDLFDQINNFEVSGNIQSFEYLTTNIEDKISKLTNGRQNAVLRHFGVVAEKERDEFDTLGFGRHRNTANWITS